MPQKLDKFDLFLLFLASSWQFWDIILLNINSGYTPLVLALFLLTHEAQFGGIQVLALIKIMAIC